MSHPNAALTPRHRLIIAQLVVDQGVTDQRGRRQVSGLLAHREALHPAPPPIARGPGPARVPAGDRAVDGPPDPGRRAPEPAHPRRPCHRGASAPLRARPFRGDAAVDVKKLGDIPDGGGWRYVGRQQGDRNRAATPDKPRNKYWDPLMGKAYVHTVINDHSRAAYAEIHDARCYTSEAERREGLDGWLHYYNHHRPHTACGNQPPFTRLTNVSGQYT